MAVILFDFVVRSSIFILSEKLGEELFNSELPDPQQLGFQ